MKKLFFICNILLVLSGVFKPDESSAQSSNSSSPFFIGADLSYSLLLERSHVDFYDNGVKASSIDIFKNNGWNLVRLRLWHNNSGEYGLKDVISYAKRIKQKNMTFLLDIFYSDTWADISKQPSPKAWIYLTNTQLADSVYHYSYNVISALKANNVMPDIVQIGNEINHGILWDNGTKIEDTNDVKWSDFAALLAKGVSGVKAADPVNKIKIMIQFGNLKGAYEFYQKLKYSNVKYDIIGISYYPSAPYNDLNVVRQQLNSLSTGLNKDIMFVETAYPFTKVVRDPSIKLSLGANAKLIDQFPITPEGQKNFLLTLTSILKNVPLKHGIGFCYWAPDLVAYNGPKVAYETYKSSWQNQTLFDINNNALPALKAFKNLKIDDRKERRF